MSSTSARTDVARFGGVCLCVTLAVSACHDAGTDPLAVILTEESRATLALRSETASLSELVKRAGAEEELAGATAAWLASWEEGEGGEALRERAYADASGTLVAALGRDAVGASHERLGAALRAARSLSEGRLSPRMARRMADAERLHERAAGHLEAGRPGEALELTLRASDALRLVGPEGVARMLTARAERAFEKREASADRDVAYERGARLVRGARLALDREEWTRAIRRAYYACQLLGISPR